MPNWDPKTYLRIKRKSDGRRIGKYVKKFRKRRREEAKKRRLEAKTRGVF